jgi:hypothetical protein
MYEAIAAPASFHGATKCCFILILFVWVMTPHTLVLLPRNILLLPASSSATSVTPYQTASCHVRFEILTSVAMKNSIFWDVVVSELHGVISQKIEHYMMSYSRRLIYESLLHGNFKSYITLHIHLGFIVNCCNCRLYRQN